MKKYAVLLLMLFVGSCKNEPPVEPPKQTLALTAEDASCTEAWLKASTTQLPATVRLLRDNQRVSDFRFLTSDSLLIDEGLLPKRTYTYQLQKLNADSSVAETSADVSLTTMDTTSHNFTWQIDTLGVTSSVLYDVAIINDTLAYAVGEMYLKDSTGQVDPQAYNMARWNGRQWKLLRIQFYTFCGQSGTGSYPAKSVFAFSSTDIWIGMDGSQIVRWDGQSQSAPMCTPVSINKLWGENPNSVYAVGNNGGIAHYNGSTWQRVESRTTLPIRDVFGGRNSQNVEYEVLCVTDSYGSTEGSRVMSIQGSNSLELWNNGRPFGLDGIWFVPGRRYIVVGVRSLEQACAEF